MPKMLQELKLSVGSLGEDRSAEGFHDFLDGHGLPGKLVLGGTINRESAQSRFSF